MSIEQTRTKLQTFNQLDLSVELGSVLDRSNIIVRASSEEGRSSGDGGFSLSSLSHEAPQCHRVLLIYLTLTSSRSKTRVAPPGISGGAPRAP